SLRVRPARSLSPFTNRGQLFLGQTGTARSASNLRATSSGTLTARMPIERVLILGRLPRCGNVLLYSLLERVTVLHAKINDVTLTINLEQHRSATQVLINLFAGEVINVYDFLCHNAKAKPANVLSQLRHEKALPKRPQREDGLTVGLTYVTVTLL